MADRYGREVDPPNKGLGQFKIWLPSAAFWLSGVTRKKETDPLRCRRVIDGRVAFRLERMIGPDKIIGRVALQRRDQTIYTRLHGAAFIAYGKPQSSRRFRLRLQ